MAQEITMYRGDDKTFPFTLTQNGATVALTGATIVFSARVELDDETPSLTLTSTAGDIVIAADQLVDKGELTLTIPATDSVDLAPGTYLCDFQVTESDGDIWTWPEPIYGDSSLIRLRVKGDVTQP